MAHAFSPKLAAKLTLPICAVQIGITNYDDKTNVGRDRSHVNYDGINVYGDEVTTNIKGVAAGLLSAGAISQSQFAAFNSILPNYNVSRTGYNEVDLTDNKAKHQDRFFFITSYDVEVIWQSKFGFGNAVYQGANRYYLNNFYATA
jgi:hypothetical protein